MVEDKALKAYKSGMRSQERSKHKRKGHKAKHSVLEALGVAAGALVFMGSGDDPGNAIDNLKNAGNGGLSNIGTNMRDNLNLPSAIEVALPVAGGYIAEKVLQKLKLNVPISKRWKL